jgi:chromosomal replication initiation ATPase DnaA
MSYPGRRMSAHPAPRQFALPFPAHPPDYGADFMPACSNAAARAWLDRPDDWPGSRLALWGEAGCGKTHLLHRWAALTGASLMSASALRGLPPPPAAPGIALDDADSIADEVALLHLLNAAADSGTRVLLAGRTPPARWQVALPDLASRLRAITAVAIVRPEESLLRALLAKLLADRQLAIPGATQDALLQCLPRTPAALREAVARLDAAPLPNRMTRPFAAALAEEVTLALSGIPAEDPETKRETSMSSPSPSPSEPALL